VSFDAHPLIGRCKLFERDELLDEWPCSLDIRRVSNECYGCIPATKECPWEPVGPVEMCLKTAILQKCLGAFLSG
jgi:hypothetical protein